MTETCTFCQFGQGDRRNFFQNELFIAGPDLFPVSPGHTLIIPRRHVLNVVDLSQEEWALLRQTIKDAIDHIERTDLRQLYQDIIKNPISDNSVWFCRQALSHSRLNTKPDAYNHGLNDGLAAGRTQNHLHWHIIPRYLGDVDDPREGVRYVIPSLGNYSQPRP